MAKDPAFLFYPGDWQGGTMLLSRHQKGCYMDLLIAQFHSGPLSLEEIKAVLGADFGQAWPYLLKKFVTNGDGLFFNERLATEVEKRKNFSESRRRNASNKNPASAEHVLQHMHEHMENENRNEDIVKDRGSGKGWKNMPADAEMDLSLPEIKSGAIIQHFRISKNINVTVNQVHGLWSVFKAQNFTGERYYASANQVYSHFINWCKSQEVKIDVGIESSPSISIREQRAADLLNSIE